jgi:integrase
LRGRLEEIAGDADGPLLPELSQERLGGKRGLSAQFGAIVRAAGLDEERQKSKSGRSLARYSAHSLRHGATTALADAGVHPDVRMQITGHSDVKSHAAYSHHSIEIRRAAVEKIPGLHRPT